MSLIADIEELKRMMEKATPGPLTCSGNRSEYELYSPDLKTIYLHVYPGDGGYNDPPPYDDFAYLAAARNTLPRLIAQVERMEAALRLIDDKIGHFAKAPKDDSMVIVSIMGDIARQTKEALKGMEE